VLIEVGARSVAAEAAPTVLIEVGARSVAAKAAPTVLIEVGARSVAAKAAPTRPRLQLPWKLAHVVRFGYFVCLAEKVLIEHVQHCALGRF